jgi:hypothetical protein
MKHESQTISPVCTAQTETGPDQRVNDYNNERRRLNTQYYTDVKGFAMGCSALFIVFSLRFFHFPAVYGSGPLIPLLAFPFIRISSPRLEHVQPSSDNAAHISHLCPIWGDGRDWCRPAFPRIGVLYSIYPISHYVAQRALSKFTTLTLACSLAAIQYRVYIHPTINDVFLLCLTQESSVGCLRIPKSISLTFRTGYIARCEILRIPRCRP